MFQTAKVLGSSVNRYKQTSVNSYFFGYVRLLVSISLLSKEVMKLAVMLGQIPSLMEGAFKTPSQTAPLAPPADEERYPLAAPCIPCQDPYM